jgi:UDP-N-acetylmuramoylalanine--D-glutamate ligase
VPNADFESGNTAILGVGREGRAAWRHLRSRYPGIDLTLIDEAMPEAAFVGSLTQHDHLRTGPLSEAGLERFDILVRSPGISVYRDCIQRAMDAGVTVTTPSNLWFAGHREQRTVCITGTKGKSTTSALLAHLLAAAGKRVRLAGNIGKPLLDCDDHDVDWWVIELSSYQLADLEAEPTVAVLLNYSPEHLDWHGSEAVYRRDKLRLATLSGTRPIVANAMDPVLRSALAGNDNVRWFNDVDGIRVAGGRLFDGDRELTLRLPAGLPGGHNLANIAAVLTVVRIIGVSPNDSFEEAADAIATFRPLPHRLQLLGERDGVRFVNDSISSTPVATAAALESFAGQPLTLIVGGLDRGLDWSPYMQTFAAATLHAVIGVPDNGSRLIAALRGSGIRPAAGLREAPDLAAAVVLARRITSSGGIVLLSPGAPSFPRFRDYRDRGRQFAGWCGFELEDRDPF